MYAFALADRKSTLLLQVAGLKMEVMKIKAETGKRSRTDKQDNRGVLEQVTNLQGKLTDATTSQGTLRMMIHSAEKQRDAAKNKEAACKDELASVLTTLESVQAERDALTEQVRYLCVWVCLEA